MLRSIGKQSGESIKSVVKRKRKATVGMICRKKGIKPGMKENNNSSEKIQQLLASISYQEECSAVIVFLQELVFALRRFVGDELRIQFLLLSPFLFRHVVKSFQVVLLFLQPESHASLCRHNSTLCLTYTSLCQHSKHDSMLGLHPPTQFLPQNNYIICTTHYISR